MYSNTSNIFNINVRQSSRTFIADIRDGNESLNTVIRSIKHTAGSNSQGYITLGSAICASVEIKMTDPGVMMLGKEYGIHIGMNIDGSPEYVPVGLFTAEKPVVDENGEVTVTFYDRMKKFETPYFSHLTYPALLTDVLSEVCTTADVPYNSVTSNISIETKPEGYTCREMLVYIAQLLGCFAIIDREGELTFKWYTDIRYTIGPDRYFSPFNKSEDNYILKKMTAVAGKETDESGSSIDKKIIAGTGVKGIMFENPFYTQSIMDSVYNSLKDMTFRPVSLKAMGDPRIEPGDILTVLGLNNEEYKVPVMNITFTYDGGLSMDISAVGEEEQKEDFSVKGPATQAIERMSTRLLLAEEALVTKLTADQADIRYAQIRDLNVVSANVTQLHSDFVAADNAIIQRFSATEATVNNLTAANGRITLLESGFAKIDDLLAGNAAATQAEMIHLNAQNAMIDSAFLKNLVALNITANDLKAGTIYTNKHTVQSEDGAMVMTGSLLTFKDASGNIRIQIGKDGQGNYNYYLVNADGDIIWDAAGITANGVPDGLIVDDMVADSSATYSGINASKLNINSMVGALNSEGGLRSSSIVMDEDNQSLTVAFSNLKSNVDNMSFGGRNLIKNTLNPDVSSASKYPRLIEQRFDSQLSSGTKAVVEHGIRITNTDSRRTIIRFGITGAADSDLLGLEVGQTYTFSCDASWRLYGGNNPTTTIHEFRINLYDDTKNTGTFALDQYFGIPIAVSQRGTEMSARVEFTFTIPDNVTIIYIQATGSNGTEDYYAAGDYIELRNLKLEKGNRASDWSPAPEDLQAEWQAADALINATISDLQDQIDGVIDTYYYDYAPTLANVPASGWATTDYPSHKGDMFLDTSTGKSYRFLQDEQTQTWSWVEIPDTASAQALIEAQNARDVADHKRRVFVDTPYVPYDVGDLWFEGEGGDIRTCTTAKTSTQQYDSADWSKLHKYTDDTYASNKYAELTSTIDGVTSRVGTLETTTTSQGQTIASHTSTLEQTATKLSAIITDSQISELDSGTNMYDKLLSVKATADGVVSDVASLNTWKSNAAGQITSLESQQNTMSQTLSGTTSQVSAIQADLQNNYSTTTAVQTLINQSANSLTISVNRTIDSIKVGGRNLIINTLDPDVSKAANYPRLVGQTVNTAVPGGTKTAVEHGIKIEVSSATRPYIRFGSNSASSGNMNGLEAGQTYTLSFDAEWKVLSGTLSNTNTYYMRVYLYSDKTTVGTFAADYYNFASVTPEDRGEPMSGRCEFTFTVAETVTMLYLFVQPSISTSSAYASGDYVELRNIKLEKGNKATDWTAAPEDYAGKGDALNNVVVEYATGDSPSTAPSTGWGTGSPSWTQGKYIWQRTAITKNGQTTYSNVSCIQGAKGEAGEAVSILNTEVKYQAHTSGTSVPTGTWQDTVPTVAQGAYLWTRTKVNYSDGTSTTSYSVGRMGSNGTNGTNGTSPTVASTKVQYQCSDSGTTHPLTWSDTPVEELPGMYYMWTKTTVTYTDGATSTSYTVSRNGTDGADGDDGRGISKVTPEYCWHTSRSSAPTSGWKTTNDGYTAAKPYMWTRSKIEYDDGSNPEYTTPVCDVTITDIETRLTSAELKITDDAIISTVSMTYGIADANLIYNSTGFGNSVDGWELSSPSSHELFADYASTRAGKTDYALGIKIKTTSTSAVYMRQKAAHWINVVQGKTYTLSGFYYKGTNVKDTCYVGVEYSTNGGSTWVTLNSSNTVESRVMMSATDTWTAFSKTFEAPAGLIRVAVKVVGSNSTTANNVVYVEDLVLVRGEQAMPWAESPTSLIEQTSEMIRLKAEKLVWTANNSSLTEEGYLTVTGGEIGGFTIDATAIYTNSKTSTSSGAILISTSDVSRTVAGKSRQSVRLAVGQNFGVLADGTLIARNVDLSGTIAATAGSIGGIKIGTGGIYTMIDAGTESGIVYKRYFSISKNGEIVQYKDRDPESFDPTQEEEWWTDNPYRTGYLYISKDGDIKSTNYTNGYWRTDGRVLKGAYEQDGPDGDIWHEDLTGSELSEDTPYIVRLYAPTYTSEGTNFAMVIENVYNYSELNPDGANVNTFILRYNGSVQCTALTISNLSSGTGSTVVANSSGKLFKSSSSKRYKDYIADMTESEAEKLYGLPVVQFKYKDGYLDREDEMFDKPMHGFFAEDVAELFEDGGIHNNFGDVENYSERAIIARLVKLVQMQHEQIESLKASMQS